MDRRTFLKDAGLATVATFTARGALAADGYYPTKVDQGLFTTINRVKDPSQPSPLEKTHAPVIKAPAKVRAGEPFTVEISVGEKLHTMGQNHWIEHISLNIGNEPAGRADFQPKGYLSPRATSFRNRYRSPIRWPSRAGAGSWRPPSSVFSAWIS